jgi:low temperature requirement protein LtrA
MRKPVLAVFQAPRLWGARAGRRATWSEQFFDLIFVAAVAQVGEPLRHDYSSHGLVRYAFLFALIWWAWNGQTSFHSRFDSDDWLSSVFAVLQTFIAAVMAANATEGLDSQSAAGFGAAYAGMRLTMVFQYLRIRRVPRTRPMAVRSAIGYSIAALIWIGSAFLEPPFRYFGWAAGVIVEAITYWIAHRGHAMVPPDGHHFPERYGLFTIILFGEFIAAIMRGIQGQESWSAGAALAAIAGLAFGFLLRSWYFDGAGGARGRTIETSREHQRFHIWNYAHLPLFIAIGLAGIGFQKLINTDPSLRLHAEEMLLLTCSISAVSLALVLIQGVGDEKWVRRRSLIFAQVAAALALPFTSQMLARLPMVVGAIALLAYCGCQAAVARRAACADAHAVDETQLTELAQTA